MGQIGHILRDALQVLLDELAGRLGEEDVDFLEGLILRFGHEGELVEPTDDGDAAVETEGEADAGHGGLHVGEEVGDEPGAEEEGDVGRFHAVGAEVGGVDFCGQDPGQAGVGAEEAFVEDETGDVAALGSADVGFGVDEVRTADDEQANEEAGKHGAGPETATEAFHVEDGGDGTEEERAAANEGHEDGLFAVEADLVHQGGHVVHNCVNSGHLTQHDHSIGVNNGAASTGHGDKVEPSEAAGAGVFGFELIEYRVLHDEELLTVFLELCPTDTLPNIEGFEGAAFVHEEAGGFGHEKHACQHDGGEDEGGAEHVTPAAALVCLSVSVAVLKERV